MINLSGLGLSGGAIVGTVAVAGVTVLGYVALRQAPPPAAPPPTVADTAPAPQGAPVSAMPETLPDPLAGAPVSTPAVQPAAAPVDVAPRPDGPAGAPGTGPAPGAVALAPTFDIVRVEADGTALIAGRAIARAEVTILLDGDAIGQENADAQGGFVAVLTIAPSRSPRILSLIAARGGERVGSQQTVILAPVAEPLVAAAPSASPVAPAAAPPVPGPVRQQPPGAAEGPQDGQITTVGTDTTPVDTRPDSAKPDGTTVASEPAMPDGPAPDVASAAPDIARGASGATPPGAPSSVAPVITGGAPDGPTRPPGEAIAARATPPDPVAVGGAPSPPVASVIATDAPLVAAGAPPVTSAAAAPPRVLLADDTGIKVVQDPGPDPAVSDTVSLDTISYDAAGDVVLGGRGQPSRFVRVYLDNDPIRTTRIGADGQWQADLPRIDTRVYTLRVDEVEDGGKVTSRTETPFRPEAPETVTAADAETPGAGPVGVVTVQPGFTLWRIARENYGEGLLYVRVFEANADKIRDPDLIYPGQIFTVPQ